MLYQQQDPKNTNPCACWPNVDFPKLKLEAVEAWLPKPVLAVLLPKTDVCPPSGCEKKDPAAWVNGPAVVVVAVAPNTWFCVTGAASVVAVWLKKEDCVVVADWPKMDADWVVVAWLPKNDGWVVAGWPKKEGVVPAAWPNTDAEVVEAAGLETEAATWPKAGVAAVVRESCPKTEFGAVVFGALPNTVFGAVEVVVWPKTVVVAVVLASCSETVVVLGAVVKPVAAVVVVELETANKAGWEKMDLVVRSLAVVILVDCWDEVELKIEEDAVVSGLNRLLNVCWLACSLSESGVFLSNADVMIDSKLTVLDSEVAAFCDVAPARFNGESEVETAALVWVKLTGLWVKVDDWLAEKGVLGKVEEFTLKVENIDFTDSWGFTLSTLAIIGPEEFSLDPSVEAGGLVGVLLLKVCEKNEKGFDWFASLVPKPDKGWPARDENKEDEVATGCWVVAADLDTFVDDAPEFKIFERPNFDVVFAALLLRL